VRKGFEEVGLSVQLGRFAQCIGGEFSNRGSVEVEAAGAKSAKCECRRSDCAGRETERSEVLYRVSGMGFFGRIAHARTLPNAG
jgi:hypothetical protein